MSESIAVPDATYVANRTGGVHSVNPDRLAFYLDQHTKDGKPKFAIATDADIEAFIAAGGSF